MPQIICFGDSITQGYTDEFGGWTQRMRRYLDAKYVSRYGDILVPLCDVFNLGISGETSAGLLSRLRQETAPRLLDNDTVIVIGVGTNDSVYRKDNGTVEMTAEQFEQNLDQLVNQAREITSNVVLAGLLPCEEAKMQPMPWSTTGRSYSNQRLGEFNQIIVNVAGKYHAPVVDVFARALEKGPATYLADGLHPNSEGHTLLGLEVQALVEPLLGL